MQEPDPQIEEIPIISIQAKLVTERLAMIRQKIYLRDFDPITLKMKHQLYVIQLPESKKGRLDQ